MLSPVNSNPTSSDKISEHDKKCQGLCQHWQKALLCIDLQYLNCSDEEGEFDNQRKLGISEQTISGYLDKVNKVVVPNVKRLQDCFRDNQFEVIHIRIQSITSDGRDRSHEHKVLGLHAAPGSRAAEFLPGVVPQDDEIVINKTASGVFTATHLEYILRNLCVSEVYIAGVYTNECISSAVRSASDLGFFVYLIADGTAAITDGLHEAALMTIRDRYAKVVDTEDVIKELTT